MPDERVAAHLEVIGSTEGDESVCSREIVYSGLAAQRTPLHMHFRSGDAALRQEQLLIRRGLHAILQRQAGAEQQTLLPGQLLQRARCRLGLCSWLEPLRQAQAAEGRDKVSAIDRHPPINSGFPRRF